jgi:hypothetical protein
MTLWFFPVALVLLVAVASAASVAVGGRFTPAERLSRSPYAQRRRYRRRHGSGPTPRRRCPACRTQERYIPVVCGFKDCPEVKPIKMTYAEYIEISDHLK